jgi:hypothetical protein
MKKYLLFAGVDHYPAGGIGDYICDYDTIEEAKGVAAGYEWAEIVEYATMEEI